jgi:hypothetical protein
LPEYSFTPFQGISGARFGEPRQVVRQRFGPYQAFRRTPPDNLTDFYVDRGLLLSFDDYDQLEFIEIAAPATAVFRGIGLLGRPYGTVLAELGEQGVRGVADDSGTKFPDLGFGLFTPAPEELSEPVEIVSLYPESRPCREGHVDQG